jgi:subtilase family serine protease
MRSSRRRVKPSDRSRDTRRVKLVLESLEPRMMLTASTNPGELICHSNLNFFAGSGFSVYSPAQIRHAYGFDQVSWTGVGQTIAIVDAYDDPTVATDLHKFDQQFGLGDPKLTVAKMTSGGQSPAYNSGWATEMALDVEWAHAVAPGANILLVEAVSASLSDLLAAVNYARNQVGVSVVSMSWGAGEFNGEGSYDSFFTTPSGHGGVTFVASSGDNGAPASWPSISSNVLSVGGTTLSLGSGSSYGSEKGWGGSGGGYSPYISEPTYQRGFQNTGHRSNPDVAYDADPYSGFYVNQGGSWYAVGGTSAGAPQWAGLIAIANQGRAAAGRAPLSSALQAIYTLAAADFHDITTGSNGYKAGVGYDAVTGRGSPIANLVVRDLVSYGATTTTTAAHTSISTPAAGPTSGPRMQKAEIAEISLSTIGETTSGASSEFGFAAEQNGSALSNRWANEPMLTSSMAFAATSISSHVSDDFFGPSDTIAPSLADQKLDDVIALDDSGGNSLGGSADPFAAVDRAERIIDRYLESDASDGGSSDQGFDQDQLDDCLADPIL